jgi:hypothetical protein
MTLSATATVWTDEAFMALSQEGDRYELLVDGELGSFIPTKSMPWSITPQNLIAFCGLWMR